MSQKYDDLVKKLREIFQIDKPDLDFGIYRIINQRAGQIPNSSGAPPLVWTTGLRDIRNCSNLRAAACCYRGRNVSGRRMQACSGGWSD